MTKIGSRKKKNLTDVARQLLRNSRFLAVERPRRFAYLRRLYSNLNPDEIKYIVKMVRKLSGRKVGTIGLSHAEQCLICERERGNPITGEPDWKSDIWVVSGDRIFKVTVCPACRTKFKIDRIYLEISGIMCEKLTEEVGHHGRRAAKA